MRHPPTAARRLPRRQVAGPAPDAVHRRGSRSRTIPRTQPRRAAAWPPPRPAPLRAGRRGPTAHRARHRQGRGPPPVGHRCRRAVFWPPCARSASRAAEHDSGHGRGGLGVIVCSSVGVALGSCHLRLGVDLAARRGRRQANAPAGAKSVVTLAGKSAGMQEENDMTWPGHGPRMRRPAGGPTSCWRCSCCSRWPQHARTSPTKTPRRPPRRRPPRRPQLHHRRRRQPPPAPSRSTVGGERFPSQFAWSARETASSGCTGWRRRWRSCRRWRAGCRRWACRPPAATWTATRGAQVAGVPATITSRVAVYFGTQRDARAFAQRVPVRPGPHEHAAATLYCLD